MCKSTNLERFCRWPGLVCSEIEQKSQVAVSLQNRIRWFRSWWKLQILPAFDGLSICGKFIWELFRLGPSADDRFRNSNLEWFVVCRVYIQGDGINLQKDCETWGELGLTAMLLLAWIIILVQAKIQTSKYAVRNQWRARCHRRLLTSNGKGGAP